MIRDAKFINDFIQFFKRPSTIDIYTDGSQKGRWGSWAFVVVRKNEVVFEASGRERRTDSHRMEFQAAIEALKYVSAVGVKAASINTDSKVLLKCFTQWRKRQPVNIDQVSEIERLSCGRTISWKWVKAHHGNNFNERCDSLCSKARGR